MPHVNDLPFLRCINLPSGSFSHRESRALGSTYRYPDAAEVYWAWRHGFNAVRLAYHRERVQPVPDGPLSMPDMWGIWDAAGPLLRAGLYVILDCHGHGQRQVNDQMILQGLGNPAPAESHWPLVRLQVELARQYLPFPGAILEVMNEPVPEWDLATLRVVLRDIIWAVRQVNPHIPIIYGWPNWSNATLTAAGNAEAFMADVIDADATRNVAPSVHMYPDRGHNAGYEDANGVRGAGDALPAEAGKQLAHILDFSRRSGQRIFLGEFNAPDTPNGRDWCHELHDLCASNPRELMGWGWWGASGRTPAGGLDERTWASVDGGGGILRPDMAPQVRCLWGSSYLSSRRG